MRVKVESTGGFTGREVVVALYDTAELPAGPAARIRDAVDDLAAAHARGDTGEVGADLPSYRITVDAGDDAVDAGTAGGREGAAAAGPRVYEVRGDPSADVESPLATLLTGPGSPT
ncbi:protealysin inhibitor emfourin [Actinomadura rubrisoli]|uniref:Uncharacterized protein n=1 Tax=Actinomadura rubrisoli TaxID=2530368 RepID=A0A4R5B4L9_9ACTN|nr:protealysin inhibitor emfourin [Actinomadura rubrisoli]TDD80771.1 hypothetical protein E1298_25235 [Actinomadura rubrisoli]